MPSHEDIEDRVVIFKRISARPNNTIERPGTGLTATSFALKPRYEGELPSWSTTEPKELLGIERLKDRDISGWQVAAVSVASVRELGLNVTRTPTSEDPGHCSMKPTDRQAFTNSIWRRLAKETSIVYTVPIDD